MEHAAMLDKEEKKPEIVVFAGPNGSGKSTITGSEWIKGPYINADDIQRELGISNLEAAQRADQQREDLVQERKSFTFETVLSTSRKIDFLKMAKHAGYFIRGYFILTCDPKLNAARVQARVLNGGHPVPDDVVIKRYHKSLGNIPEFLELCDICHIYDNTIEPFRICRKHKLSLTMYESPFWSYEQLGELIIKHKKAEFI